MHVTGIYRDNVVFDGTRVRQSGDVQPVPGDLAAALRAHRQIRVNSVVPVTIGGRDALRLDVSATGNTKFCVDQCVTLFPSVAENNQFILYASKRNVLYLFTVGVETIVFSVEAPGEEFDELARLAEEILSTIGFLS